MPEYVRRDPYTRTTLMREKETVRAGTTCDWCGGVKTRKNREGKVTSLYLWRYSLDSDSGHSTYDGKLFCSASCRKCYNM